MQRTTLGCGGRFNHRRLLQTNGTVPPMEADDRRDATPEQPAMAAALDPNSIRQTRGISARANASHASRPNAQDGGRRGDLAAVLMRHLHRITIAVRAHAARTLYYRILQKYWGCPE